MATARVRAMAEADVDDVAAIEQEAFTTPWKADTFRSLLGRDSAVPLVLELPEVGVVGYAMLWCIVDQGEIANIAIHSDWRGKSLGAFLLDQVIDVAREAGVRALYLEVRESNRVAALLYESRGFVEIGRRRDYYDGPREDARVLQKRI